MNPVLVQCTGLGYLFNMYPRQAAGTRRRHRDHLPSAARSSSIPSIIRVTSSSSIAACARPPTPPNWSDNFEAEFARNPTYIHMYRYGHAYHGVHPFYMWYWGEPARQHVGRVIAAGCEEPEVAARMGWESADTLDEAIAMATSDLGRSASITYLAPAATGDCRCRIATELTATPRAPRWRRSNRRCAAPHPADRRDRLSRQGLPLAAPALASGGRARLSADPRRPAPQPESLAARNSRFARDSVRLREHLGDRFDRYVDEKLTVLCGDITEDGPGLRRRSVRAAARSTRWCIAPGWSTSRPRWKNRSRSTPPASPT